MYSFKLSYLSACPVASLALASCLHRRWGGLENMPEALSERPYESRAGFTGVGDSDRG
jgi:hypothetical protein